MNENTLKLMIDLPEEIFNKLYLGLVMRHKDIYDIQLCWDDSKGTKYITLAVFSEKDFNFVQDYFRKN